MTVLKLGFYRSFLLFAALAFLGSTALPGYAEARPESSQKVIVEIKAQSSDGIPDEKLVKDIVEKYAKVKTVKKALKGGKKSQSVLERNQRIFIVEVESAADLDALLKNLSKEEAVAASQPNYFYEKDVYPNDPMYASQWAHSVSEAGNAWDITTGSPTVAIAVIGTGVKWNHEDLAANIWSNGGEVEGNSIDDDNNGYVDDVRGWNFAFGNNDPADDDGHETAVAGVAAAVANNNLGIAGVCWSCKVMPLKVDYTTQEIVNAIYYAVDNGAKVINMSFGSYTPDPLFNSAIDYAASQGVILVGTAGNNSISDKRYPAAYEPVIAVAAINASLSRSSFSNWGDWVDVAAPGESVLSTNIGFDKYSQVSGTSFAAPYVAGVAGLLLSQYPDLLPLSVRERIEYTANKLSVDKPVGSGSVNAYRAVSSSAHPGPFAVIKNLWENFSLPLSGSVDVWGSALGDSYTLSYKGEGESTWTSLASGSEVINGLLGAFNVDALSNFASVALKLSVNKGLSSDSHLINVIPSVSYHTGFPKSVGAAIISAPNFYSFNNDGKLQTVFGDNRGFVHILNENGTYLANWPQSIPEGYIFGSVAVGDITGEGIPDVVATSYGSYAGGAKIYAWRKDGVLLPGWPKSVGQMRGGAVLANLDSDKALEVIVGAAGIADGPANVYAYNGDGSIVPGWPYTFSERNFQTTPAVGDVNADGRVDIVAASASKIAVLNADGTQISLFNKGSSHTSPVLANLDGDPNLEILMSEPGLLKAYTHTGSVEWSRPVLEQAYNQLSVGDLDNDGAPEVLFSGSNGSNTTTYVYSGGGVALPSWPQTVDGNSSAEPIVADVNGDNNLDVIVATQSGKIAAFDRLGQIISGFPKNTGTIIDRSVGVADIDGNGMAEMVAVGEDGQVRVWDLETAAGAFDLDWRVSRHDNENSGNLYHKVATSTSDTTNPSISIISPATGSILASPVTLEIAASDNVGVTKVEIYNAASPLPLAILTNEPYNIMLPLADGDYTVSAMAYDASGNTGLSEQVSFSVRTRETIPPNVSISSPLNGSMTNSPVNIIVDASDNVGVASVDLYLDNSLVQTFSASPFEHLADLLPGSHEAMAVARDADGNAATSTTVQFEVRDTTLPNTSLTTPVDGASVSSPVTISADASDNIGVSRVELYVDDLLKATLPTAPYSTAIDLPAGSHSAYSKAYDATGNAAASSVRSFTVLDTIQPTVSITSPLNGATVRRNYTTVIQASASDNVGVSKVEFYVNNALRETDLAAPYSYSWLVPQQRGVPYTITVKAYDSAQNSSTHTITVTSSK